MKKFANDINDLENPNDITTKVDYNTHLVNLNLDNIERNYNYVKRNCERLLVADDYDLKVILKRNCKWVDNINWEYVDLDRVRENIANLERGE